MLKGVNLQKVTIENFQSIAKLELFVKGMTVLVGNSDVGKSAVVRAIASVFLNPVGQWRIRKGANKCSVGIELSDGRFILWEKGKTSAYSVMPANVNYIKMGREVPKEVSSLVCYWDVGQEKVMVQIQNQFDVGFLLFGNRNESARKLDDLEGKRYRQGLLECQSVMRTVQRKCSDLRLEVESQRVKRELVSEVGVMLKDVEAQEELFVLLWAYGILQFQLTASKITLLIKWVILQTIAEARLDAVLVDLLNSWLVGCKEYRDLIGSQIVVEKKLDRVKSELFVGGVCPLCGGRRTNG